MLAYLTQPVSPAHVFVDTPCSCGGFFAPPGGIDQHFQAERHEPQPDPVADR